MRKSKHALAALLVFGGVLAACQIIAGIEDRDFRVVDRSVEGSVETSVDGGPPDPCPHRGPPDKPDADDDDKTGTYVLALKGIDLRSLDDAGSPIGFDIDQVCTCDPRVAETNKGGVAACAPRPNASPGTECDPARGIDNKLAEVIGLFTKLPFPGIDKFDVSGDFNRQIDCGRQTLLIVMRGYNGKKDDAKVKLSFVESYGIFEAQDPNPRQDLETCYDFTDAAVLDAGAFQDGGIYFRPKYNGTDKWSYPRSKITKAAGDLLTVTQLDAYVKDYTIAIDTRNSPASTTLLIAGSSVIASSVALSAKLVPLGPDGTTVLPIDDKTGEVAGGQPAAKFRIDRGELGGRIELAELLTAIGLWQVNTGQDPSGRAPLCKTTSPSFVDLALSALCPGSDLMASFDDDFKNKTCNAISFGFGFTASAANVGDEHEPTPVPSCDGGAGQPYRVTCP